MSSLPVKQRPQSKVGWDMMQPDLWLSGGKETVRLVSFCWLVGFSDAWVSGTLGWAPEWERPRTRGQPGPEALLENELRKVQIHRIWPCNCSVFWKTFKVPDKRNGPKQTLDLLSCCLTRWTLLSMKNGLTRILLTPWLNRFNLLSMFRMKWIWIVTSLIGMIGNRLISTAVGNRRLKVANLTNLKMKPGISPEPSGKTGQRTNGQPLVRPPAKKRKALNWPPLHSPLLCLGKVQSLLPKSSG